MWLKPADPGKRAGMELLVILAIAILVAVVVGFRWLKGQNPSTRDAPDHEGNPHRDQE